MYLFLHILNLVRVEQHSGLCCSKKHMRGTGTSISQILSCNHNYKYMTHRDNYQSHNTYILHRFIEARHVVF